MGRATRWLRNLLGIKKSPPQPTFKDNRKWSIAQSFREKPRAAPPPNDVRAASSYRQLDAVAVLDEDEQNKRAIAVAAATAAVAEAAVAAAHAAAAVVRLTSGARGPVRGPSWAAVKIQAAFRGYLARRALRALRGLVKLQALVRGNIVRKQATETLRCMQSLVRVQARTRACRALQSEKLWSERGAHLHAGPPTPEKHEQRIVQNPNISSSVKRNSPKPAGVNAAAEWNMLDKWMEERYWDTREAIRRAGMADDEKNAKILEVDTGKPQFIHKRSNHHHLLDSTSSKNSTTVPQSVPSPASVEMPKCISPIRLTLEPGEYVESPQFYSASSRHGSSRRGPFTPAKSECSRSLFSGYSDYPNYMANTESYRAKLRSHSAPKQRPEFDKSNSTRRASSHGTTQNPTAGMSHRSSSQHGKALSKANRLGMTVRM